MPVPDEQLELLEALVEQWKETNRLLNIISERLVDLGYRH